MASSVGPERRPDPVTIAQVTVDDAYWAFSASERTVLNHLGGRAYIPTHGGG